MSDGSTVSELPAYRAMLVVDMKSFSGEPGRDHATLTESIPQILSQAFRRCGHADLWDEKLFHGTTGDGYYAGFTSRWLPYLLNPFLGALQDELAYQNSVSGRTIRMRVSVNVGPLTSSGSNTISDGSGEARIENHRLLDSEPVRDLLDRSSAVTCVAAIVSARAFEDAVISGYSAEEPGLYVAAPVQVKSYQGTAYLRVPRPSGDLLDNGFRPDKAVESETQPDLTTAHRSGNTAHDVGGSVAQGDGRVSSGVGDVSGSENTVTSVQGNQHNGDRYSGGQHFGPHYEGRQDHSTHSTGDGHTHVSGGTVNNYQHSKRRGKR